MAGAAVVEDKAALVEDKGAALVEDKAALVKDVAADKRRNLKTLSVDAIPLLQLRLSRLPRYLSWETSAVQHLHRLGRLRLLLGRRFPTTKILMSST